MYSTLINRQDGGAAAANPWTALWAMMVGFFMILVDATIVAVANPSIMAGLGASYDAVIWVTSAYLLAYAVPLLVAGRLGDQFGPKNLYLVGLVVFTVASLWCGLSDSIGMLIAARVLQGVGAALLTPQTLSTVTRIFPAAHRGAAMSVWGSTAAVATLVGPLAGGVLVDAMGWQWIFFVNVPVGIFGVVLAARMVPTLPTEKKQLDLPGVVLSGVGMFMIVFALQEGQSHDWAPWVWGTIAGGIGFLAAFMIWQSINTGDPLIPLAIFRDRDFSLSNLGVATIGFVVTAMIVPVMFYAQAVCGLSPTRSALLTAPMAIATGVLAPLVGRIVDRSHPRPVIGFGFSVLAIALTWLSFEMTPTTAIWRLLLPLTAMGIGMAFIWSPLAATATRNLPPQSAGAGSGVYNTTRQVGSVLGSAAIAAFMTWRISAEIPRMQAVAPEGAATVGRLPASLQEPFAASMSQTLLLPAFVALLGVIAALFLLGFGSERAVTPPSADGDANSGDDESFDDDDDYVEYVIAWDEPPTAARADDGITEPLPRTDTWRRIFDELLADDPPAKPRAEPIGFAHNGFHVDDEERFRPVGDRRRLAEPRSSAADAYTPDIPSAEPPSDSPARHRLSAEQLQPRPFWFQSSGRHSRQEDPGEAPRQGRHSSPWRD
jgi:EmrB/QacA subfamily drug resistance transporter